MEGFMLDPKIIFYGTDIEKFDHILEAYRDQGKQLDDSQNRIEELEKKNKELEAKLENRVNKNVEKILDNYDEQVEEIKNKYMRSRSILFEDLDDSNDNIKTYIMMKLNELEAKMNFEIAEFYKGQLDLYINDYEELKDNKTASNKEITDAILKASDKGIKEALKYINSDRIRQDIETLCKLAESTSKAIWGDKDSKKESNENIEDEILKAIKREDTETLYKLLFKVTYGDKAKN